MSCLANIRWPETIAAIALSIQAVIFLMQWAILREHGDIMKGQAETATLIRQTLDEQRKILDAQTKILDEQFKFQRRIEAKPEREQVFKVTLDLYSKFLDLRDALSAALSAGTTVADIARLERVDRCWSHLEDAISPCDTTLITAIHFPETEKTYFRKFAVEVDALVRNHGQDAAENLQKLKTIAAAYKDFGNRAVKAGQTPA